MFQLSKAGQIYLLELSRKTIQEFFQFGRRPSDVPTENELLEKRAVFVTLTSRGHLRGCVGYVTPLFPLHEGVINCSVSAATDDPRFQPLNFDELEHIEIEISVLSSMKAVKEVGQIEIGTHGLLISHKGRRGLLLPQVAVEHGWDRERFLSETCRKAGLPLDSWEKGALIEFFTATVFGEKDLDRPSMAATDEF